MTVEFAVLLSIGDADFVLLMQSFSELTHIKIINFSTKENFIRELTDISEFGLYWIFSWKHEP